MDIDPIGAEDFMTKQLFNLEEILDFQREHKIEVIMQSDLQYHCFIDFKEGDGSYASAFTPLNAMIIGIKQYKNRKNEQ